MSYDIQELNTTVVCPHRGSSEGMVLLVTIVCSDLVSLSAASFRSPFPHFFQQQAAAMAASSSWEGGGGGAPPPPPPPWRNHLHKVKEKDGDDDDDEFDFGDYKGTPRWPEQKYVSHDW